MITSDKELITLTNIIVNTNNVPCLSCTRFIANPQLAKHDSLNKSFTDSLIKIKHRPMILTTN